jgi:hypothetical protein
VKNSLIYSLICYTVIGFGQNRLNSKDNTLAFIENKGQVCDQYYKPRPDVLFYGSVKDLSFCLKPSGVSYQLNKVESWKEIESTKHKKKLSAPRSYTSYRLDIDWLNCNTKCEVLKEEANEGYTNYYLENCPNGINNVGSFNTIKYKNIYPGIDLKWYQKDGQLKYDYIVSPGANHKQIQLKIKGTDHIYLRSDGSVLLQTKLGDIIEGAPKVYQNGKLLASKWNVKGDVLSFEIENFDTKTELIIDPNVCTRVWGTYFGGFSNDYINFTCTDNLSNVYITGITVSASNISTSGAHQINYGGGTYDAFLAKFNSSGNRIWATYYGGSLIDAGAGCCVDPYNNVYMVGHTWSASGTVIATPGSYQPTIANTGSPDGFIVKFDASGVRQWGTYYGDSIGDQLASCSSDKMGNIYVTGYSSAANSTSSVLATTGTFKQYITPYNTCAIVAKFSTNGSRIWGSYFGDFVTQAASCQTDKFNNIYIAGSTRLITSTLIASPGCHQSTFGGGPITNYDGFIAKFDTVGNRSWGTYYGGAGNDDGYQCATDTMDNVYLVGRTGSGTASNVIATSAAFQPTASGGSDAFLVKFNGSGIRQWGTHYGGNWIEYGWGCATNKAGDIYICGTTQSTTDIATFGSHQQVFSGGSNNGDGFLGKFNTNGIRLWGTYYGGVNDEDGWTCAVDANNNVYLAGYSVSSSSISTSGAFQTSFSAGSDGFLVKFSECMTASPVGPISGTTIICPGVTTSLSVASVSDATSYVWALPSGWTGTSTTNIINVTPYSSGVVTVMATNTCAASNTQTFMLSAMFAPTVTAPNGTICIGQTFTMNPTGAVSYTYSSGSSTVAPSSNTTYTIMGTASNGCVSNSAASVAVAVNPLPTISVNSGSTCSGNSFTIIPSGANSYTVTGGQFTVNPNSSTSYTITGTSTAGCTSSLAAVCNVTVSPTPTISVASGTICRGDSFTITPTGANSYTIEGGQSIVSPIVSTSYTVAGTSTAGCSAATATCYVTVNPIPTISVNSGTICSGNSFTIIPIGASTYTFSNGNPVSPTVNTSYGVTGTSSAGCVASNTAICNVSVNPSPTVTIASNQTLICVGGAAILTASGALTYTWSNSSNNNSIVVSPTVTTVYTVTGSDANGCENSFVYSLNVSTCNNISSNSNSIHDINIYPNPTSGVLNFETSGDVEIVINNSLGQNLLKNHYRENKFIVDLSDFSKGIYLIEMRLKTNETIIRKLILD